LLHEKLEILYANNIDILVVHFILDECWWIQSNYG